MAGLPHAIPPKLRTDVVASTTPRHDRTAPGPKHCLSQLSQLNVSCDEFAARSGGLGRGEP
eukprot:12082369-Alexandrium_andersonii.AAC.1